MHELGGHVFDGDVIVENTHAVAATALLAALGEIDLVNHVDTIDELDVHASVAAAVEEDTGVTELEGSCLGVVLVVQPLGVAVASVRFFEEVRHGGETSAVGDDTGLSQLRRSVDRSGPLVGATPEGDEGDDRGV